jgi:UrcA family protein
MKTLIAILGCLVQTAAFAWNAPPASPQPPADAVQRHLFENAFPAVAAENRAIDGAPSVVVKFGDLDLSQPEQAATLYDRLQHAACEVCPPVSARDLSRFEVARSCYKTALARAVRSVDQASLTRLHDPASATASRSAAR